MLVVLCVTIKAQDRKVENRPYTDLRPFHFGVVVGSHFQDLELNNVGPVAFTTDDGTVESVVSVDQDRWDPGFQVGVLGEARISNHLAFRLAPMMIFGNRHLTFLNYSKPDEATGAPKEVRQNLKSVYVAGVMDLIFSAKRFNNHRPYFVAGLTPMLNLTSRDNDYLRLNKSDVFLNVGIGCDLYLPFFKLRPELKMMYGLTNSLDKGHADRLKDPTMKPYALSVDKTRSKLICVSLYFE